MKVFVESIWLRLARWNPVQAFLQYSSRWNSRFFVVDREAVECTGISLGGNSIRCFDAHTLPRCSFRIAKRDSIYRKNSYRYSKLISQKNFVLQFRFTVFWVWRVKFLALLHPISLDYVWIVVNCGYCAISDVWSYISTVHDASGMKMNGRGAVIYATDIGFGDYKEFRDWLEIDTRNTCI